MPTSEAIREALQAIERQFDELASTWPRQFVEARTTRLQFLALVSVIGELGRDASASAQPEDRETAKLYFQVAERLGERIRRLDGELAVQMAPNRQMLDFNDPSPREMSAAMSEWRQRLTAELTPTG